MDKPIAELVREILITKFFFPSPAGCTQFNTAGPAITILTTPERNPPPHNHQLTLYFDSLKNDSGLKYVSVPVCTSVC